MSDSHKETNKLIVEDGKVGKTIFLIIIKLSHRILSRKSKMKLQFAAFALTVVPATAFTASNVGRSGVATTTSLFSTAEAPAREAPDAGWVPEWEDREGLPQEEFLYTDMSKPDLSGMWECPLTRWDSEG